MYDCSKEIMKFHDEKIRLPEKVYSDLKDKRNTNRERVKKSLADVHEPTAIGMYSQGSYAMKTIVQAEDNDFDIDDGIYFSKDDLVHESGKEFEPWEIKDKIKNAIEPDPKKSPFSRSPEVHNNCVRVFYSAGYHVDIPVYRKVVGGDGDYFELAAENEWKKSDARAVTKWFEEGVKTKSPDEKNGRQMRRIVRMLKHFAKTNKDADIKVASGFAISKLVDECYEAHTDRDDKALYYTMQNIKDRLEHSGLEVDHPIPEIEEKITDGPTDPSMQLLKRQLGSALNILKDVFTDDHKKALTAWGGAFAAKEYFETFCCDIGNDNIEAPCIWTSKEPPPAVNKHGENKSA